jgi:parvulin-like peptidyl-prolyl isomerase
MPYQRVILTVGDDSIKTGYFLKRVAANSSGDAASTVDSLTSELIIKQAAPDFGLSPATEADIDTYLRDLARGENETITDAEFDTWFNDRLASTGLTAKEYREIVGGAILAERIQEIVSANVPSVVPQVHLSIIVLDTNDAAISAKARIDGGEDFAAVASDVSIYKASEENVSDLGWLMTEVLNSDMRSVIDVLDIGKCSDPFPNVQQSSDSSTETTTTYILFMVSEKSAAMQVTDDQLATLKYNAMLDWLDSRIATTEVTFHGLNGSTSLDSETLAWINYQVQKLTKNRMSTATTSETTNTTP